MAGAELRNIDALLRLRDALIRFRDSTSSVSSQMCTRIDRVQEALASRRAHLETEIETQRAILSGSEDEQEREDARRILREANEGLAELRRRHRALATATAHYHRMAASWHHAMGETMPAAAVFLDQKHAEAADYSHHATPEANGRLSSAARDEVTSASAAGSGQYQSADPVTAGSSDELPSLPSEFTWIPIDQFDLSSLPSKESFKKVSYSDMLGGVQRLWDELIPTINTSRQPTRAACEAFDEMHGRVDKMRMGFTPPDSVAKLWDVFFGHDHIRVTLDKRTGAWGIDNGQHRIRIARDIGWKYVPGKLATYPKE